MTANREKILISMARACMNAKDIALKAQMPEMSVKNVLSGRSVKPRTLGRVARALGVDVADLLESKKEV